MNFQIQLEPDTLKKQDFIQKTNGKDITVTRVGNPFNNVKFKKNQVILVLEQKELNVQTKWYLNLSDLQYSKVNPKASLYKLLALAFTGDSDLNRSFTYRTCDLKPALENKVYNINWITSGKYPFIKNIKEVI